MKFSDYTFGCHGIPERCFKLKGKHLPFCARCLGASIGHIFCALMYFLYCLPTLFFSPIGLLVMFTDWTFQNKLKLYHSNFLRFITGLIGGFSVGLIIWTIIELSIKRIY